MGDASESDNSKLTWCTFCGSDKNMQSVTFLNGETDGYSVFCKGDECWRRMIDYHDNGQHTDMRGGVPVVYEKLGLEKYHKTAKRVKDTETGKLSDLTCDYCGVKNSQVVTNTGLSRRYKHANFCKNDRCCFEYVLYVQNVRRIPHALCVNNLV